MIKFQRIRCEKCGNGYAKNGSVEADRYNVIKLEKYQVGEKTFFRLSGGGMSVKNVNTDGSEKKLEVWHDSGSHNGSPHRVYSKSATLP